MTSGGIVNQESTSAVAAVGSPYSIACSGVVKRFGTGGHELTVLDGVDLRIRDGEFVSIVGPSGCGKSTLLSVIAGLGAWDEGEVSVAGVAPQDAKSHVGVVFQDAALLDWRTAIDNVLLQAEVRKLKVSAFRDRAVQLLHDVGLGDSLHKYPDQLSGGMRQRVALCRALLHDPEILLMDEPFGALDALTRDKVNLDLVHLWETRKKSVLFITHDIEEAVFLSDRVLVMSPRPGMFIADIAVTISRPRELETKNWREFHELVTRIRQLLVDSGSYQ